MQKSAKAGVKTGTKKSQAYKNTRAYSIRYHDDLKKLQDTAVLDRVCTRCYEQLQWKLQYGKYKPLKQPKKCQACSKKTILKPYRTICNKCADENGRCSKCGQKKQYDLESYKHAPQSVVNRRVQAMQANIKMMQERSKRKIHRLLLEDLIRFRDGKFFYKANNTEVEGIYYKKKYWEDLGIEDPLYGDDYNELDDLEEDTNIEENTQNQIEKPIAPLKSEEKKVDVEDQIQERSGIKINF